MRMSALLVLVILAAAAPAAWAQTTTTTTASTTTTDATTSTTAASTTTTTAVTTTSTTTTTTTALPCGSNCLPLPPTAVLSAASDERRAVGLSFFWTPGSGSVVHGDAFFINPPPDPLPVVAGSVLTLRFDPAAVPTQLAAGRYETSDQLGQPKLEEVSLPVGNPAQFRANFPTGEWDLIFDAVFPQGSADYLVRISVTAPSPSGAVHFTG